MVSGKNLSAKKKSCSIQLTYRGSAPKLISNKMNSQKLEEYKKRLEKERAELIEQIDHEKHDDFGSDVDEDEEADETESFGTKLAVNQGLRERVNEIDLALNRMRENKYGICANCGKEITEDILKISPESSLCKNCKTSNR